MWSGSFADTDLPVVPIEKEQVIDSTFKGALRAERHVGVILFVQRLKSDLYHRRLSQGVVGTAAESGEEDAVSVVPTER